MVGLVGKGLTFDSGGYNLKVAHHIMDSYGSWVPCLMLLMMHPMSSSPALAAGYM